MAIDRDAALPLHFEVQPLSADESPPFGRTVLCAVGSRAELTRLAPVVKAFAATNVPHALAAPSWGARPPAPLYDEAGLPRAERLPAMPAVAEQQLLADALVGASAALAQHQPALVVTAGNSPTTVALALAASKQSVAVARVGAGHRERDFSAPGEVDRMVADHVAELLFADGPDTAAVLHAEGVPLARVHISGSTAIDMARRWERDARSRKRWRQLGMPPGSYVLATVTSSIHLSRDDRSAALADGLRRLSLRMPVALIVDGPEEDRTRLHAALEGENVRISEPLPYLDFLSLEFGAASIVTDSASVQEEAAVFGVRCFTLGNATARTSTLTHGSNVLLGDDARLIGALRPDARRRPGMTREFDDGRAALRIASVITRWLADRADRASTGRVAVG